MRYGSATKLQEEFVAMSKNMRFLKLIFLDFLNLVLLLVREFF